MSRKSRVILLREVEGQVTGSGCCGRVEGDFLLCGSERVFPEQRAIVESMGPLYTTLRARFGDDLEIEVVDPRNLVGLATLLIQDFWRFRVHFREILRTLTRLPVHGVLLNGRVVSRGEWPEASTLVGMIERESEVSSDHGSEVGV